MSKKTNVVRMRRKASTAWQITKGSDEWCALTQMWLEGYTYAAIGKELGFEPHVVETFVHDVRGYARPVDESQLVAQVVKLYPHHSIDTIAARVHRSPHKVTRIVLRSGLPMHRPGWREGMTRDALRKPRARRTAAR